LEVIPEINPWLSHYWTLSFLGLSPYVAEIELEGYLFHEKAFMPHDQAVILLAEDREDDILLVHRAFTKGEITNPLFVVRDGDEAISYLSGIGKYGNRAEYPLPDLLLLDLKMPRVDGFEVLRWVRQQAGFSSLRVVVLTASDQIRDVNTAYRLGANSFMVKPTDFENVVEMAKTLRNYWLQMSKSPQLSRPPAKSSKNKS
jgi:CheY-like chemotaxis protein